MKTVTISAQTAKAIMIPVYRSKAKRDMFQYIASQSMFDPYKKDDSDLFVTYTIRENGFLKDLFISDETGNIHRLSNRLTFANNFFNAQNLIF
jgi:hypothetical protein